MRIEKDIIIRGTTLNNQLRLKKKAEFVLMDKFDDFRKDVNLF